MNGPAASPRPAFEAIAHSTRPVLPFRIDSNLIKMIMAECRECPGMPVGVQQIECPSCETVVDVSLGGNQTIVDAGIGHDERDGVVNQLCTNCLGKLHVEVR